MTNDDQRRNPSDLTPSQIASANFRYVRRGYDAEEVDRFLAEVAQVVDRALSQATAMEARARAAVARLNEQPAAGDKAAGDVNAETISRTLMMAQRAADAAVDEARVEAEQIRNEAVAESERVVADAQAQARRLVTEATARAEDTVRSARDDARRANEEEFRRSTDEVAALRSRREVLVGEVDQVEQFLVEQRERLRDAARQLELLCERIPGGLGSVTAPTLSTDDDAVSPTVPGVVAEVPVETVDPIDHEAVSFDEADDEAANEPSPVEGPAEGAGDAPEPSPRMAPAASEADPDATAPLDREAAVGADADPPSSAEPTTPLAGLPTADAVAPLLPASTPTAGRPTPAELGTLRLEIAALVEALPADAVGEFDDTGEFEPTTEVRLPMNELRLPPS